MSIKVNVLFKIANYLDEEELLTLLNAGNSGLEEIYDNICSGMNDYEYGGVLGFYRGYFVKEGLGDADLLNSMIFGLKDPQKIIDVAKGMQNFAFNDAKRLLEKGGFFGKPLTEESLKKCFDPKIDARFYNAMQAFRILNSRVTPESSWIYYDDCAYPWLVESDVANVEANPGNYMVCTVYISD